LIEISLYYIVIFKFLFQKLWYAWAKMVRDNPKFFFLLSAAYLFSIIILFILTCGIRTTFYAVLIGIKFLLNLVDFCEHGLFKIMFIVHILLKSTKTLILVLSIRLYYLFCEPVHLDLRIINWAIYVGVCLQYYPRIHCQWKFYLRKVLGFKSVFCEPPHFPWNPFFILVFFIHMNYI
jgi:hypothetical protein